MRTLIVLALTICGCADPQAPSDSAAIGLWTVHLDEAPCGASTTGAFLEVAVDSTTGEFVVTTEGIFSPSSIEADGDDAVLVTTHYNGTRSADVTFHLEDDASSYTWDTDDGGCSEAWDVWAEHSRP